MAQNKSQHYVPKFYFKLFSKDGGTIGMYNYKRRQSMRVPIATQCQQDYFYAKEKELERELSKGENLWRGILRKIIEGQTLEALDEVEDFALRLFVLFQRARTFAFKQQAEKTSEEFTKWFLEVHMQDPDFPKGLTKENIRKMKVTDPAAHWRLLPMHVLAVPCIADLRMMLLVNETDADFIFSDAPVVFFNQWQRRFKSSGTTGFQNPGLQIFCPISPRHYLLLFDAERYEVRYKTQPLHLHSRKDVQSLNDLQFYSAISNLYFADEKQAVVLQERHPQLSPALGQLREVVTQEWRDANDENHKLVVMGEQNMPYDLTLRFLSPLPLIPGTQPVMRNPATYAPFRMQMDALFEEARRRKQLSDSKLGD